MSEPRVISGGGKNKSINDVSAQIMRIRDVLRPQIARATESDAARIAKERGIPISSARVEAILNPSEETRRLFKRLDGAEETANRYRNNIANNLEEVVNWRPDIHEDYEYADDYETKVPRSVYASRRKRRTNRRG